MELFLREFRNILQIFNITFNFLFINSKFGVHKMTNAKRVWETLFKWGNICPLLNSILIRLPQLRTRDGANNSENGGLNEWNSFTVSTLEPMWVSCFLITWKPGKDEWWLWVSPVCWLCSGSGEHQLVRGGKLAHWPPPASRPGLQTLPSGKFVSLIFSFVCDLHS